MSLKICFFVVLVASVSIAVLARTEGDCNAPAGSIYDCSQSIYSNCKNATFIADRLAFNKSCSSVSLFWDAPQYNMTILFKSGLSEPYELCIKPVGCTNTSRTLDDGRETSVEWNTFDQEPVCFKSQRSDSSTMKFRFDAGSRWHCYGTFIRFSYRF
jgi:hypothetical protein